MTHPPRIPVWLPEEREIVYFVTLCVEDRKPVLSNVDSFKALNHATIALKNWWVYAAMLMPDHLHLIVAPLERDLAVGNMSAAIKRWMRKELNADWKWQAGCFDRLLRTDESAQAKWEYIRENPVRAGLVKQWDEWPYGIGFRSPP
jgi:REP-associated tyrosine transposase